MDASCHPKSKGSSPVTDTGAATLPMTKGHTCTPISKDAPASSLRGGYRDDELNSKPSSVPPERGGFHDSSDSSQYRSNPHPRGRLRGSHEFSSQYPEKPGILESSASYQEKPGIRESKQPSGRKQK